MKVFFQNTLKVFYAFVEQFVFYIAAIIAFLCWVSFENIYLTISLFILICILFWAIPSVVKRNK